MNVINQDNPKMQNMPYNVLSDSMIFGVVKDVNTALTISLDVTGKVLTMLGVPFVGPIVSFYKTIVNLLWPRSSKEIWEELMNRVEELVDQKIAEYARNKAITELEGLRNVYVLYLEALEEWKDNPNNLQVQERVRTTFRNANSHFNSSIPQFAIKGYEVPLLTVYAQAANLHLLLLKDATLFGKEWGFTEVNINDRYKEQTRVTATYTDYCISWYKQGLERLKGSSAKEWIEYHRFRREMTLMVLDIVSLFPNYDARMYSMQTVAQLTREVYTDPIAYNTQQSGSFASPWTKYDHPFSTLEEQIIRKPHLFNILKSIEICTGKATLIFNDKAYMNFWNGHILTYSTPSDNYLYKDTYGFTDTDHKIKLEDYDIYKIDSASACLANWYHAVYGVTKVDFSMIKRDNSNKTSNIYSKPSNGARFQEYHSEDELPIQLSDRDYSHILSHITYYIHSSGDASKGTASTVRTPVYVWTHRSADYYNAIHSDKITQIPLNKANDFNAGFISVKNDPGFLGGSMIYLRFGQHSGGKSADIKLPIKTEHIKPGKTAPYRVRFRAAVAISAESRWNIRINKSTGINEMISGVNLEPTMQPGENLKYESFQYFESKVFQMQHFSNEDYLNVSISGNSTMSGPDDIYIDRIEFIPVNATYESEADL